MLVLEPLGLAIARGAHVYAEVKGYGLSADGFHVTSPEPSGAGASRAMRAALRAAALSPDDIDYVSAHGTGTPANDRAEAVALRAVFGERAERLPVSSVKSMIGHSMGAASAIESVVAAWRCATGSSRRRSTTRPPIGLPHRLRSEQRAPARALGSHEQLLRVRRQQRRRHLHQGVTGVATTSGQVAITGVGVVSPLGCGWEEFSENLRRGTSGIGPVTTLDLSASPVRVGAEVRDLRADERLGGKGLKYVMRGTRLLAVGVQQALADAGLEDVESTWAETGLVVGTAHGNFPQTTDYTQKVLTRDPVDLLPMEGFDAALNSATNFAAVRFKLQACTRTVSSGASGADALGTAAGLIRSGQATRVVAGGMEQLSLDAFLLAAQEGRLAQGEGQGLSMPYDRRRRGFVVGEGCYLFVLEDRDVAVARGARVRGAVAGYGARFTGGRRGDEAVRALMATTLDRAGVAPGSLDLVSASANSTPEDDRVEATAILRVMGSEVPVTAVKSMLGECMGASGALQAAAALVALESGTIPPTINTTELDPEIGSIALVTRPLDRRVRTVLVPALDLQASSACLVLRAD